MAHESLRSNAGITTARRHTVAQGWYLHVDHDAAQKATGVISPEITTFDWADDQSGRVTIVAGKPYRIDGSTGPIPQDTRKPGTVLSGMSFSAGSFGAPTVEPPPTPTVTWVDGSRRWGTLSTRPLPTSVRLLGTTNDRVGRPVVGVAADSTSSPGNRIITLISATTGRIVGMETIRTTPIDDLPVGAVTSYTIWENAE